MTFDPNAHMLKLKSKEGTKDYLPVQWRLVWFREQCDGGTIDTEELQVDLDREVSMEVNAWNSETRRSEKVVKTAKGYARFRAVVTDGKGGRATGTKSESAVNFADYIEKAETGAIGRALAALGYGTQFTGDELSEGVERLADAPVEQHPSTNGKTLHALTAPGSYEQHEANGHQTEEVQSSSIPSVKQLQARCTKLCGAGYWQAMLKVALKLADGVTLLDKDITIAHRISIHKYLEYVDANRPATGGR